MPRPAFTLTLFPMSCGCSPCQTPLIVCNPPPVIVTFNSGQSSTTDRLDITAFTGGLANCLDFLAIGPFATGSLVNIQIGGPSNPIVTVQKVASVAAPVVAAIIRPPDYDPVTNAYQWYVVG